MKKITHLTKFELLGIIIVLPIFGFVISKLIGFDQFEWTSLTYALASLWWLGSIYRLNKIKKAFNTSLSTLAGVIVFITFFLDAFFLELNWKSPDEYFLIGLNVLIPICAHYLIYILTRLYGLTIEKKEPKGLDLFPKFLWLILFPIGIWKYQDQIKSVSKY